MEALGLGRDNIDGLITRESDAIRLRKKVQNWDLDPTICIEEIRKSFAQKQISPEDRDTLSVLLQTRTYTQYRRICMQSKPEKRKKLKNKLDDYMRRGCLSAAHCTELQDLLQQLGIE